MTKNLIHNGYRNSNRRIVFIFKNSQKSMKSINNLKALSWGTYKRIGIRF